MWVHAASVGESTAALTFIHHVKKKFPHLNVLITTITVTSADIIKSRIEKISNCCHQYVVADNPFWIKRFLDHWKVDVAVFLESEIWPNIIDALHSRNIPTFLLNARLSPKSFRRWKLGGGFFSLVLRKFKAILAQSPLDEERFRHFSPDNTTQMDNLKYANPPLPYDQKLWEIFSDLCKNKKVLVAASTHEKEEEAIIEAHLKLKKDLDVVTLIIPRHLTRLRRVCEVIRRYGLNFFLRSEITEDNFTQCGAEIYCIDSFGEVGTFFRIADVCFVGGSLVPLGGHNIHEPVALGKPVLHGPFMNNALEIRDFLHSYRVAFEVRSADEIAETCHRLMLDNDELKRISEIAQKITKNEALAKIDEVMQLDTIIKNAIRQ
jgi:3-deoxy-D-manno-octulosonic-acid transferase